MMQQLANFIVDHDPMMILRRTYARRVGSQLYKLAVEQNLCNHILAEDTDMDARDYQLLRGRSVREVQSTNGRISFKEALDFQKTV